MAEQERELGWDDEIQNDSPGFAVAPEGDYDFTVVGLAKERHEARPGGKIPDCPKAVYTLRVMTLTGPVDFRHNLFLHSRCEGMICEFFTAIGHRQHGQRIKPNYQAAVGATGRCKVGTREHNGNTYNEVKKFYEPKPGQPVAPPVGQSPPPAQPPVQQAPPQAVPQTQTRFSQMPPGDDTPF